MRKEKTSIIFIALVLGCSCLLVSGMALFLLYHQHVSDVEAQLSLAAKSQARLIEAMARANFEHWAEDPQRHPEGAFRLTMNEITAAHEKFGGIGATGEFALARLDKDSIVYELRHRGYSIDNPRSFLFSTYPGHMRKALSGQSGVAQCPDYRGARVLAAYEPVAVLNMGLIAKIDMEEVRAPFVSTFRVILALTLVITLCGVFLVIRSMRPVIGRLRLRAEELKNEIERRTHSENALQESEEQYRSIIEHAHDLIWTVDGHGNFTYLNPRCEEISGYNPSDMLGRSFAPLLNPNDLPRIQEVLAKALSGELQEFEVAVNRADGSHFTLDVVSAPQYKSGEIVGVFSFGKDITDRKKAEQALRESEQLFRSLFENMLNGFGYCKMLYEEGRPRDFIYLNTNSAFEQLTGLKNVVGKKASEAIPGIQERDPELIERYGRVASTGVPERFEMFVDALNMWFSISVYSPENEYFVAVFDVITERKHAEEKARENTREMEHSKNVLMQVLESIPVRVFWKDRELKYLGCNTSFAQDAGFDRYEELLQRTDYEMGWKDQADRYRADDHEVMRSGRSKLNIEEPQTTPDGKTIWLKTSKVPLRSSTGDVWGVLGLYEEITERKFAQEKLAQSLSLLEATLESTADGILVVNLEGKVAAFNQRFLQLWRIPPEIAEGRDDDRLLAFALSQLADPDQFISKVRELYAHPNAESFDLLEFKDGRCFERFSIPQLINHQVAGRVWSFRDITERKRAEQEKSSLESQLRQAQKMEAVGTMAGGIAHDFNNILVPILVYTDMAAKSLESDHPAREDLHYVIESANRAKDLVKQILAFSRQTEQERFPIDPAPIIKEALKLLRASIPTSVEIAQDISSKCGAILADPSQIHQVLMNLCTNASHAMQDDGGTLSVALNPCVVDNALARAVEKLMPGDYVLLTVSDTGCGMKPETVERIFEPFFTTKQVGEGTGLGLSVVHGIVSKYEGAITVESDVGRGTIFSIYFPRVSLRRDNPAIGDVPIRGGTEHVLIVDDEPSVANSSKAVLERLGYTVTVRTSSIEALELLRQNPKRFDLVLTDQAMPHMTGDHLAKEIISIRPEIPIILMTGFSHTVDEAKCRKLGIDRLLMKPLLPVELARAVRAVLDGVEML